ncbi:MAG: IclR family transcriptional regulator C-terminal domain-containing protein, partial [Halobacteriaceae archaeon]
MMGNIGARRLPHANAAGKAILAHLPEDVVHDILDRTGLPEHTKHTITSRKELFDELDSIRERGYAVNRGEYH